MSKTPLTLAAAAAVAFAVTSHVLSQSASRVGAEMDYSHRSAAHEVLDWVVGEWVHEIAFRSAPDAEPEQTQETAEYQWIMGGRFLLGEYKGSSGGSLFKGMEVVGYDNFRREYRSFWIDNLTTAFTLATGQFDENAQALTMEGVQDDVEKGLRDQPFKVIYRYVNDNEMAIEVFYGKPGGGMYKAAQVRSFRTG